MKKFAKRQFIIIIISLSSPTVGHRPPPRISTSTGLAVPASNGFLRPWPDRHSTWWRAFLANGLRTSPPGNRKPILCVMKPAHCHFHWVILRVRSVAFVLLRISSFLIMSRREMPSIAISIAHCATLSLFYTIFFPFITIVVGPRSI